MKTWRTLPLAVGLFAMSVTTATLLMTRPDPRSENRSAGPVKDRKPLPPHAWRPDSTGLFVGVQKFPHDPSLTVPYAVDDAVDLAYKFSLDQRSSLIPPRRIVLALSGDPHKEESQQKLRELRDAGARVASATSGDIVHLLNEQAGHAGAEGLFVLTLATHGFLDQAGDAYILGSTSAIGSPETSVRTATMLDVAGRAARSLVFIDACRDRAGMGSRGAASDPATAAPLIRKMQRVQGQVIFYAAAPDGYAFDDDVRQNGVFTRAVLDGLDCKASAPRGEVVAETLHTYVEREVRRWIRENRKGPDGPATQVSMEGGTHAMPLAQCWRDPLFEIRASVDGSTITAYDNGTRPLWRKDLGRRIVQTAAADLDADAFYEVIAGTENAIILFDRDGRELWKEEGNGVSLATFTTGDLFRKHTRQIVALWTDGRASRLTIFDSAGTRLSNYEEPDRLRYVAIDRETNRHAPRIAVASTGGLFLLEPKKTTILWRRALLSPREAIDGLRIHDADNDSRREIEVSTKSGTTLFAFDGTIIQQHTAWKAVRQPRSRE